MAVMATASADTKAAGDTAGHRGDASDAGKKVTLYTPGLFDDILERFGLIEEEMVSSSEPQDPHRARFPPPRAPTGCRRGRGRASLCRFSRLGGPAGELACVGGGEGSHPPWPDHVQAIESENDATIAFKYATAP